MGMRRALLFGATIAVTSLLLAQGSASAEMVKAKVVRIAELEIDPAQVEAYKAALKEGIEEAIRREPGVLLLYAVSVKGHPEQIRLMEMYADTAAYQAHLKTAHFLRYKAQTAGMVRSLTLIETEPLLLGAKP